MQLPHQFTKDPFGSIASDRISKSLPYNNRHATRAITHFVSQKIEEGGRKSTTMMFDDLNVSVTT